METPVKFDLHMHTTVSDGTDAPERMPERAREAGLRLFAVTDHDAVKGCRILRDALTEADPAFLTGVEFSCKDEQGKYHILGYGYDPETEPIQRVVRTGHGFRMKKVRARLDFLKTEFGFTFPEEEIAALFMLDNPGKPHIGNMMVKYGYAPSKEKAITEYINKVRFRSEYVRPEEAIRGILGSGGIPVLAHPAFGSGDELIVGQEMDARLKRLTAMGLQGVEAFYSGFTPKIIRQMLDFAEQYGLYVTAGSDYHGTNKLIPLGDTGLDDAMPWPDGLHRFLEEVRTRTMYGGKIG
ncbi:MAG: PHP domain-containing protein [Oscillospiraceae bacterium]|nr:PHP domain-containing protein [Oscillospiraceae bacterium]